MYESATQKHTHTQTPYILLEEHKINTTKHKWQNSDWSNWLLAQARTNRAGEWQLIQNICKHSLLVNSKLTERLKCEAFLTVATSVTPHKTKVKSASESASNTVRRFKQVSVRASPVQVMRNSTNQTRETVLTADRRLLENYFVRPLSWKVH